MRNVRILVADDHPIVAEAIKEQLDKYPGFAVYPPVGSSTEIFAQLDMLKIDVLVADYSMPGGDFGDGLTMLRRIRERFPKVHIVVFTSIDSPVVVAALQSNGFLSIINKCDDIDELIVAIDRTVRGDSYLGRSMRQAARQFEGGNAERITSLSCREAEVLRMYLAGSSVTEIANALRRSAKTINNQKRAAMAKLSCKTDAELFKLQAIGDINAICQASQQNDDASSHTQASSR